MSGYLRWSWCYMASGHLLSPPPTRQQNNPAQHSTAHAHALVIAHAQRVLLPPLTFSVILRPARCASFSASTSKCTETAAPCPRHVSLTRESKDQYNATGALLRDLAARGSHTRCSSNSDPSHDNPPDALDMIAHSKPTSPLGLRATTSRVCSPTQQHPQRA